MRMDELYDDEDDGGLADAERFEWEWRQAELLLMNDPAWPLWLEWVNTNERVH